MRKKIIFILLALLMLGTIAYFYINRILLPEFHASIENKLSEYIQRPVTIGKIGLEPTKGFRLSNVLVRESARGPTLVQIDEIECTLLIAPFFRDKTIVIPNITIRRPIASVIQHPDGSFNFTDIFRRKTKAKTADSPQVFVTHVKVVKGSIDFLRKTPGGDFSENLRDIGIDLSLSMDRQIDFRGKTVLPFENSAVEIRGRYTLGSKNFYTEISASQFNLLKYQRQFFPLTDYQISAGELATCDMRMDHLDGKLKFSGNAYLAGVDIHTKTNRHLTGDIRLLNTTILLDNGALTAKGEIRLPATQLTLTPEQTFEGDLQMFVESLTRKNGEWFLSGNLKAQNVNMAFANNRSLQTHLTSRGTTLTYKNNQLSLFGEFDFDDLTLAISNGRRFRGQVFAKNFSFNYTDGTWHARSALRSEKSRLTLGKVELVNSTITSEQLSLNSDSRDLNLSGKLQFIDAVFAFGKSVKFEGSPQMNLSYRRPKTDPDKSIFAGDLDFQNGLLFGIPRVQTLSNLEGLLRITKAGATTDQIRFNVENTNIDVSGSLDNWADLNLDVKASTPSVELSRVTALFPELFQKYAVNLDGRASMELDFQGTAKSWKSGDIQLAAGLIDTRLSGPKLPEDFSEINGNIRYSRDNLAWSGLKAKYKEFPFELTGHLENFSRPVIDTALTAAHLKARAKINLLNKTIRVPSFAAQYHHSDFDGSADIYFIADQGPDIQINGEGTVYASDIPSFLPHFREKLEPYQLEGVLDSKFFFKGSPSAPLDWSISVDAKTPKLTVKNHPLQDVKINYLQRDKNISKFDLTADIYGGKLKFDSAANLENKQLPFKLGLGIYGADLAQFIANHRPNEKNELAGTFLLDLGLEGNLRQQNTWQGQGNYKIENGYIWNFKIIKLLNKILIQEFVRTVYTDSAANFTIADRKIKTENLQLKSDTISLLAKGSVDFDQKIAFDVYPALSEIAQIQSDEIFRKLTTVVISKTLNIVKLSGTLKEPKTKIVATDIPTNIIKGTTNIIKGVSETLIDTIMGQ